MRERPIIFSAPMVRAILDGRKTQTRRLITPQPSHEQHHEWRGKLIYEGEHRLWCWRQHTYDNIWDFGDSSHDRRRMAACCPNGTPGDRLWVRESWSHDGPDLNSVRAAHEDASPDLGYGPYYRATEVSPDTLRWISPLFMPRWASRITLEITDVRVQQLQEISEEDARAEGCTGRDPEPVAEGGTIYAWRGRSSAPCPRAHFLTLWDAINGKRCPWSSNPWVWAISFRKLP